MRTSPRLSKPSRNDGDEMNGCKEEEDADWLSSWLVAKNMIEEWHSLRKVQI